MTTAPRRFPQKPYAVPPGSTVLLLVRHGQSEAVVEGEAFPAVDGHGDPALTDDGVAQAESVCRRLAAASVDAIYVSTLRRTAQSAAPLATATGLVPVVEPDLREVFLGEWEGGVLRQKIADNDPVFEQIFADQRWDVIPGAEPAPAFSTRVAAAVGRIAAAHRDRTVAVFTHGGVIGEILAQTTRSEPLAFAGSDNASLSEVVVTDRRWVLRRYNDTAHLAP